MSELKYVPHINQFLQAMRVNRRSLDSNSKVTIDAKLLKALLRTAVKCVPFSEQFYLETYPDIAQAYAAGQLKDLKQHYVEQGYFEGRVGAPATVDKPYYLHRNGDVAEAMTRGDFTSVAQHYHECGYREGRSPSAALEPEIEMWSSVLPNNTD